MTRLRVVLTEDEENALLEPVRPSILDDLRDLWAEVKASPGTHLIAAFLGLAVGCFGTVGIAYIYAAVAF